MSELHSNNKQLQVDVVEKTDQIEGLKVELQTLEESSVPVVHAEQLKSSLEQVTKESEIHQEKVQQHVDTIGQLKQDLGTNKV